MAFDQLGHQCNTPIRRNIREADKSRMRHIVQKDELPEICVNSHQNPAFGIRAFEQHPITRIATELASFENIVLLLAQPGRELPACAPIDEKPHYSATVTADRESLAIIACA